MVSSPATSTTRISAPHVKHRITRTRSSLCAYRVPAALPLSSGGRRIVGACGSVATQEARISLLRAAAAQRVRRHAAADVVHQGLHTTRVSADRIVGGK